jgi:hypothetical protein
VSKSVQSPAQHVGLLARHEDPDPQLGAPVPEDKVEAALMADALLPEPVLLADAPVEEPALPAVERLMEFVELVPALVRETDEASKFAVESTGPRKQRSIRGWRRAPTRALSKRSADGA